MRLSCSLMLIKLFSSTGQSGLSLWHGVTKEGALHSHLLPLLASSANTSIHWILSQGVSAHWRSTEFTQEKAELSRTDSQVSVHAWLHCRLLPSWQPAPFKCFVTLLLSEPSQRTEKLPKLWVCRRTKHNYHQLFRGGRRNTAASSSCLLAVVHSPCHQLIQLAAAAKVHWFHFSELLLCLDFYLNQLKEDMVWRKSGSTQPRGRQGAPNVGKGVGQNQRNSSFWKLVPAAGKRRWKKWLKL